MGNFRALPNFFPKTTAKGLGKVQNPYSASYRINNTDFILAVRAIDIADFNNNTQAQTSGVVPHLIKLNNDGTSYKVNDRVQWIDKNENLRFGKIHHIWKDESGGVMSVQLHDEFNRMRTISATQIHGKMDVDQNTLQQYKTDLMNYGIVAATSRTSNIHPV